MWKLVIKSRTWVKVSDDSEDSKFYLPRSHFMFTRLHNSERPVIFGGQNRNGEFTNDIILIDFDICLSDTISESEFTCLPCAEGYSLNSQNGIASCEACGKGSYHDLLNNDYSSSKCKECPIKTYNDRIAGRGLHSCKLCGYGTFNSFIGKEECSKCPIDKICLPGSEHPSSMNTIIDKVDDFYLKEENYPDFISSNRKVTENWQFLALIISFSMLAFLILVIFILKSLFRKKISRVLISLDFLPVTGGGVKKLNGGILTVQYVYANIVLITVFVLRFLYYNELIEVIPISSSHGSTLNSSFRLNLDLIGYEYECINSNQKIDDVFYLCSSRLLISKSDSNGKISDLSESKQARCQITEENVCRVSYLCENCKTLDNGSSISVNILSQNAYVQLFYWTFESVWGENLDYKNGYSKLDGIFMPDSDIK